MSGRAICANEAMRTAFGACKAKLQRTLALAAERADLACSTRAAASRALASATFLARAAGSSLGRPFLETPASASSDSCRQACPHI